MSLLHIIVSVIGQWMLLLWCTCRADTLYRYKLLSTDNPDQICPYKNETCSDGSRHFLCRPHDKPAARCGNTFSLIKLDHNSVGTFVNAHNGIRSKVASDFDIGNMNLVYWSAELAIMAVAHVYQCRIGDNACNTIGNVPYTVGLNYQVREHRLLNRWPGRVVRHWYLELGLDMNEWSDVIAKYRRGDGIQDFMQLTWPQVEFIGCAAAHMFKKIYIVCYYQPAFNVSELTTSVRAGEPCSQCPPERPTCSRLFISLCGIDVPINARAQLTLAHGLAALALLLALRSPYLW